MILPSIQNRYFAFMNQYLMQLSPEAGMTFYNLLGNLQFPVFFGFLILATIKYREPPKHKVVLWLAFAVSCIWSSKMVSVLEKLTGGIISAPNMGIAFGLFVVFLAAIAYSLHVSVLFSLDAAIPAFVLGRGLAITGCIFAGCCHGYPVSWGVYSSLAKTTTFPTVFLDIALSCSISVYLIFLARKQKYSGNGLIASTGMILFGLLRLLIDILRDNEKLCWMMTAEGLLGIIYVAAGWLLFRTIFIRGEKNEN